MGPKFRGISVLGRVQLEKKLHGPDYPYGGAFEVDRPGFLFFIF